MGTNQRTPELKAHVSAATKRRKAEREARRVIGIWNSRQAKGLELWFIPTIRAAVLAEHPWLSFYCPACQQTGEIDLRTIDRHPHASIESLIPSLSCRRCRPNAPFAQLIGLNRAPTSCCR